MTRRCVTLHPNGCLRTLSNNSGSVGNVCDPGTQKRAGVA